MIFEPVCSLRMPCIKRAASLLLLAAMLAGCSVIPEKAPVTVYQLPVPSATGAAAGPGHGQSQLPAIRIATPAASPILNGDRILVSQQAYQVMAYKGVRWNDTAPRIVRNHLAQALKNHGQWQAVTTDDSTAVVRYQLGGELVDFLAHEALGQRQVVIRFDATLVDTANNRVVGAESFVVRRPVDAQGFDAVIETFGKASQQLGQEVALWLVRQATTGQQRPN